MQRIISVSLFVVFISAIPAQAQLIRRPLVYQVVHSPFVNQLVNFGIQQVLPGFPTIPIPQDHSGNASNSTLLVDASVRQNIDATTKNLRDADDIMKGLLTANKDALEKKDPSKKEEAKKLDIKPELVPAPSISPPSGPVPVVDKEKLAAIQKLIQEGEAALKKKNFAAALLAFEKVAELGVFHPQAFSGSNQATVGLLVEKMNALDTKIAGIAKDIAETKKQSAEAKQAAVKALAAATKIQPVAIQIIRPSPTDVVSILRKGPTKLTIELAEPAPESLSLVASAKLEPLQVIVLSGTGMIQKNDTKGVMTISIADPKLDISTLESITIEIAASAQTKAASFRIKAKVNEK